MTANEMVQKIKTAMEKNIGVTSVSVDGMTTTFTPPDKLGLLLDFWERRANAQIRPPRRLFRGINLSNAW